jgi:hypothetical protein
MENLTNEEMRAKIDEFKRDKDYIMDLMKKLYLSQDGKCQSSVCHIEYLTDGEKTEYGIILKELKQKYKYENFTTYNISKKSKTKTEQQMKKCYNYTERLVDNGYCKFKKFL